ncbi:MAG: hypothetical protein ACU84Q_18390 [Gammaproteobacteria bacterium]
MKKLLICYMLTLPFSALAEHLDVIEIEMTGKCSHAQYMTIVGDFNKWGEAHGYQAKIAVPLQSNNVTSTFWIGTTANAATFGKAWDAWRDAHSDSNSEPSKLTARLRECSTTLSRRGYDAY